MKVGTIVKIGNIPASHQTTWATMYSGQIGIVESRCQLYKNSWSVRFTNGDDSHLASFKPEWLEVVE